MIEKQTILITNIELRIEDLLFDLAVLPVLTNIPVSSMQEIDKF